MENRYKIDYDVRKKIIIDIKFQQGDSESAVLEINLSRGNDKIDLTSEEITFKFLKSDKNIVTQDISNGVTILDAINGKVECVLMGETLSKTGIVICQIYRKLGDADETAPSFSFMVNSTIGEGPLSGTYISAIENKVIEMDALITKYGVDFQTKYDGLEAEYATNLTSVTESLADMTQRADAQNVGNPSTVFAMHRGASTVYPENSLPAFEMAGRAGAKIVEFDIQPTNDNFWVVMHDLTLDRMTNGVGSVSSKSLSEIQSLIIDGGQNIAELPNLKIPTLDDVLRICKKYSMIPMIEIKNITATIQYDVLLSSIIKFGMINKVIIIAGVFFIFDEIRTRTKNIELLFIGNSASITNETNQTLINLGNSGYTVDYTNVTQELVELAHNSGLKVSVWTINTPDNVKKFKDMGVDYIVSDKLKGGI